MLIHGISRSNSDLRAEVISRISVFVPAVVAYRLGMKPDPGAGPCLVGVNGTVPSSFFSSVRLA